MKRYRWIVTMVLAFDVLAWGVVSAPAADRKVLIKLSDQVNEQNPHYKTHEFFAKTVAEKSGGSIEVKIFPNSQLGTAREGLEGALTGTIQAVKVTSGELSTYSPKFLVFSLPYIFELMKLDLVFVLLGTGEQMYHDLFHGIAQKFPQKSGIKIGFDNALAHKIEAGCDMFLMPSRYEPCGTSQMISMRYGCLPLVSAVGGLLDTVTDGETGFTFDGVKIKAFTMPSAVRWRYIPIASAGRRCRGQVWRSISPGRFLPGSTWNLIKNWCKYPVPKP